MADEDDDLWERSVNSGIPIRRRVDSMTPGPWERDPQASNSEEAQ